MQSWYQGHIDAHGAPHSVAINFSVVSIGREGGLILKVECLQFRMTNEGPKDTSHVNGQEGERSRTRGRAKRKRRTSWI